MACCGADELTSPRRNFLAGLFDVGPKNSESKALGGAGKVLVPFYFLNLHIPKHTQLRHQTEVVSANVSWWITAVSWMPMYQCTPSKAKLSIPLSAGTLPTMELQSH